MTPTMSGPPGLAGYGKRLLPVTPTPELQNLYDEFRRVKEEHDFKTSLALQADQDPNGQIDLLRPRTPSQATTMSRSPSGTSCKSAKPGDSESAELPETPRPDTQPKRRAMRRGPLGKVEKARAAFYRKLGACQECRGRKVKCDHYDLEPFQRSYDVRKARQSQASILGRHGESQAASRVPSATGHLRPTGSLLQPQVVDRDMDLRGVSANPATTPFRIAPAAHDTAEHDMDILSQLVPTSPNPAPLTSQPQPFSRVGSYATSPFARDPALILSSSAFGTASASAPTPQGRFLAIGRQLSDALDEWECQWACNTSDGTESLFSFNGEATACLQHCYSLRELSTHYESAHGVFREAQPPFMWKCRFCQLINVSQGPCPQCSEPRSEWEKWYYGHVGPAESIIASGPLSMSVSEDQASVFGTSRDSAFSSQGYSYSEFPSLPNDCPWYSPRSGTGGSFLKQHLDDVANEGSLVVAKVGGGRGDGGSDDKEDLSLPRSRSRLSSSYPFARSLALVLVRAYFLQIRGSVSAPLTGMTELADELVNDALSGRLWRVWADQFVEMVAVSLVMVCLWILALGSWALEQLQQWSGPSVSNRGRGKGELFVPRADGRRLRWEPPIA